MGLDYSLKLSTDMPPSQALRLMAEHLGLVSWDESHLGGPAIWIGAVGISESGRSLIKEGFHFSPDISVLFRLDPNEDDYEEGNRVMLRAVMLLLEHGGDGVLLFNGERIILQRLAGDLVLNAEYGNWTQGLCLENEIRLPHGKRPLPSPLL